MQSSRQLGRSLYSHLTLQTLTEFPNVLLSGKNFRTSERCPFIVPRWGHCLRYKFELRKESIRLTRETRSSHHEGSLDYFEKPRTSRAALDHCVYRRTQVQQETGGHGSQTGTTVSGKSASKNFYGPSASPRFLETQRYSLVGRILRPRIPLGFFCWSLICLIE